MRHMRAPCAIIGLEKKMKNYPYKLETHMHTVHNSDCAKTDPRRAAEVYAQKGYNGVICTNHFNTHDVGYLRKTYNDERASAAELFLRDFYELKAAGEKLGLDVFCGAEISPDGTTYYKDKPPYREFLIIGVTPEELKEGGEALLQKDQRELFEWCDERGALLVQAHPFREICTPGEPRFLHGAEISNLHPLHNSKNKKAAAFARANNLIATGGSDFHFPLGIGGGMLLPRAPKDDKDLAALLKARDFKVIKSRFCGRII